jgi:hypothetical protein
MLKFLLSQFVKKNGRTPNAIEMLQLKFKASQQVGKGEVVPFPRERITDWTKARPQPPEIEIIDGVQTTRGLGDLFERQMKNIGKKDPALYEDRGGNIIPAQFEIHPTSEIAKSLRLEAEAAKKLKNMSEAEIKLRGNRPYDTDEQIIARIKKQNKEAAERLKNKKNKDPDEPEGFYQGGQAQIEPDLSNIGHGSDALMARNRLLTPGSQATTSTGLNYLLGEDNDTTRVPYKHGDMVLPKPKPMDEYLLKQVMSQAGANTLNAETRQMLIEELKEKIRKKNSKAEGGRTEFSKGKLALKVADKGRRGFMKAAGATTAGIAALKTGLLGFGEKVAPVAKETVEAATSAIQGVPPYFFKLVEKIKNFGVDTPKLAVKDREIVTTYKDYTLTEDVVTGEKTIQRMKIDDDLKYDASEYYGKPVGEETYMSYRPGKGQIDETTKGKTPPDEYTEDTSLIRSDRPAEGEIMDTFDGVPDDVIEEAMEETIKIGKADGGRIGYGKGDIVTKGIPALIKKIQDKFGKKAITTADKLPTPQKTLDRDMFKNFETKYPETSAADATLNIPVQQEGKFTKAEYLIQRLENTIKESPNDKYVQDTFPGFINELKTNPELAKNENVFKELGGDLPEGQQIVVYGDDTLDFFTQKSGPGNIDRIKKIMSKYNISKDKALKIMKMEPNDQVMEFKMLEIANRKLNAEGGRIGMLAGGGILKTILKNSADAKGMTVRDFIMAMNPNSIPSNIKNLISKVDLEQLKAGYKEYYENIADMMKTRFDFQKNVESGKTTPAKELFESMEKTMDKQSFVPKTVTQDDIAKTELMIKNKFFGKDKRKLQATGGLARMLGE